MGVSPSDFDVIRHTNETSDEPSDFDAKPSDVTELELLKKENVALTKRLSEVEEKVRQLARRFEGHHHYDNGQRGGGVC